MSVRQVALRSPMIFNQIFMHLPSNCLKSACSLVNKMWHRVTRTVLRDHGQCLANISSPYALKEIPRLERFCARLKEEGRVVPFNGLRVYDSWHTSNRSMPRLQRIEIIDTASPFHPPGSAESKVKEVSEWPTGCSRM